MSLMILGLMVITGCSNKEVAFEERITEVPVIVPCQVGEATECRPGKQTYTQEIRQMLLCINQQAELLKQCKKSK